MTTKIPRLHGEMAVREAATIVEAVGDFCRARAMGLLTDTGIRWVSPRFASKVYRDQFLYGFMDDLTMEFDIKRPSGYEEGKVLYHWNIRTHYMPGATLHAQVLSDHLIVYVKLQGPTGPYRKAGDASNG